MVGPVPALGAHVYVYGPVPPDALADAVPFPLQFAGMLLVPAVTGVAG